MNNQAKWYVVHTYSGYENKVKTNLEYRIASMGAQGEILNVVVPMENEIEIKGGKKVNVKKKIFSGYLLIQMNMNDHTFSIVRNTPGVAGLVSAQEEGGRLVPVPLAEEKVEEILRRMKSTEPRVKVKIGKGESVRIADGPFIDFIGVVENIFPDKGKAEVLISVFGRETPLEVDLLQLERL
jgi:transcriptional antiterminator NusG